MYKIYKTSRGKLTYPSKPTPGCWIDINSPTPEDIQALKPYIDIEDEIITTIKDCDEVPKVEDYYDYQLILVQTPLNKIDFEEGEYETAPLGILYNDDYVVTITDGKNDVISYLKTKLKNINNNRIIHTEQRQQLILKLLLFSSKIYLHYLKIINRRIFKAQDEIEKSTHDQEMINLMDIGKSLAYFNHSLRSNSIVHEKIGKRKYFSSTEEDEELLEDIHDETKQAIETVKIYDRIVVDTSNNFSILMSNNLNKTVKTLTSITIILMLPTLVASVYGMNISLPFQNHIYAFPIVSGGILLCTVLGIIMFYRKKLF